MQSAGISVLGGEGEKLLVDQHGAIECASLGASTSHAPDGPMPVPVPADSAPSDPTPVVPDLVPVPAGRYVRGATLEIEAREYCPE